MVAAINSFNPMYVKPVQMTSLYAYNSYAATRDWEDQDDLDVYRQQKALQNINAFNNEYQSSYILQALRELGISPSGNITTDLNNVATQLSEMYIQAPSQDDRISVMQTIKDFQSLTGVQVYVYDEEADQYIQGKLDERRNQILMGMNNVAEMNKYFLVNRAS